MPSCDLILCWGQSNMLGRGDAASAPASSALLRYVTVSGPSLDPLVEPAGESPYQAISGDMLPAFGNAFVAATGQLAVFQKSALGGKALVPATVSPATNHWGTGGSIYTDARTRALSALSYLTGLGYTVRTSILWAQGEQDIRSYPSSATTLRADYANELAALLTRTRADLSDPTIRLYVIQTGDVLSASGYAGRDAWQTAVRGAQQDACDATDGLVMAHTGAITFAAEGRMKADALHYNQAGLNEAGTVAGRVAAVDLGYTPAPPLQTGAHRRNAADFLLTAM